MNMPAGLLNRTGGGKCSRDASTGYWQPVDRKLHNIVMVSKVGNRAWNARGSCILGKFSSNMAAKWSKSCEVHCALQCGLSRKRGIESIPVL